MKKILLVLAAFLCVAWGYAQETQECGPFAFPSYNVNDSAAADGWGPDTFQLSQNYPAELPARPRGGMPWEKIDLRRKPVDYLKAVLDYCWEGMEPANFVAQQNEVRTWYHAPWMHAGYAGREYLRGLVMDRTSFEDELHPKQNDQVRNYSITFYNPIAAFTLGQVWCDPMKPAPAKAKFAEGSVIYKMIFTMADTSQVPFLNGALEWDAYAEKNTKLPIDEKEIHKVRLLQIDVAIRTNAADAVNGWVFGVYVFDGRKSGASVKDKFVPAGLQWGNDPGVTPQMVREGEKALEQTWINTNAWIQDDPNNSIVQKLGWGYRLMGPVGKHATSIMSEHMTAGWPPAPASPPSGIPMDSILHWHRNVPGGEPFMKGQTSLDYSLELRDGIRNFNIEVKNDSTLEAEYTDILAENLGFRPPAQTEEVVEEEEDVIEYDEGLKGKNLYVFIGFLVLVVVLVALLIRNFMKK